MQIAVSTEQKTKRVAFIADRSGSMDSCRDAMISGANEFFGSLKADQSSDVRVTYTQFDDQIEVVYSNRKAKDVPGLHKGNYVPRGMTALCDAIGSTLAKLDEELKYDNNQTPIVVAIMTDGLENASKEYTRDRIREMIQERESRGNWTFVFLGRKDIAWTQAADFGISAGNVKGFTPDAKGTQQLYASLNTSTTRFLSSTQKATKTYFNDQED